MSVVVTVAAAGVVAAHAPALMAIAAAAAASIGLRVVDRELQEKSRASHTEDLMAKEAAEAVARLNEVEVSTATAASLESIVAERCSATFSDERMTLTVERDIRGRLTVKAHGEPGVPRVEVSERAAKLLGAIQQQIAYREAMATLKKHGFQVEHEERLKDGTAKVRVVKRGG